MDKKYKDLLTYKQLSEILPYGTNYLRQLVSRREIPFYKISRYVYFDEKEIDEWMKNRTHHFNVID